MCATSDAVFEIPLSDAPDAPRLSLTRAQRPATASATVVNHQGQSRTVEVPGENALTVYLDKQEIVTLMTLGQAPEALIMGYLRNQRLVASLADLRSVHVDWEVGAGVVHTRKGHGSDLAARMAKRTVTTGCGQGTMFGDWLDALQRLHSDATLAVSTLDAALARILALDTVYKRAGSVHACALLRNTPEAPLVYHVEDVGRHNAVDAITGLMWLDEESGADKIFYTTGRLTSEMVMKTVQMGVPFLISRSGLTQMGLSMAQAMGITLVCRARVGRHLVYSHGERITRGGA
ncbi:formate dehydrogenase accessory sulfurtransferase FdhD [Candidatus Accumulibacter sp. ACC003]|uniref:formate dehydrogenase accessory sulfurtransferase FdhD n=1 Tax=Candidatus Accumulibacter sp. ACC003 TaxID=2823334 RepID=UPI0025C71372|nr:formate dehydrogenase accessory sulfurtransferase FdhD [Candidatus Accumulibacter sp. ACC003]